MSVYSSVRHRLTGTPPNLGKKLDFSSTKFTLLKIEYYRQEYTKRGKKKKSPNKQTSTFTVKKFWNPSLDHIAEKETIPF